VNETYMGKTKGALVNWFLELATWNVDLIGSHYIDLMTK
jgi:hypothetical protein